MTADGLLHRLTHRVPGVPAHTDQPGHTDHNKRHRNNGHRNSGHEHRPPKVLVGWQSRIAALAGRGRR